MFRSCKGDGALSKKVFLGLITFTNNFHIISYVGFRVESTILGRSGQVGLVFVELGLWLSLAIQFI